MILTKIALALGVLAVSVASAGGTSAPVSSGLTGTWKVTAYRFGDGVSVGDDQAKIWLGKTVTYAPNSAVSGKDSCKAVKYSPKRLNQQAFLEEYRTSLKSVGLSGSSTLTTSVMCNKQMWTAFGSTVLNKSGNQLLTIWDGVYFVLQRQNR